MTTQNQDPELVEPNTETTQATEKATVRRPGWKKDPTQSPSPESSGEPAMGDGSAAGPGSVEPREKMPDDASPKSGGSRTSSPADPATREALRDAVEIGFAAATTGAHEFLVKDPYAKYAGLFLADEQDLEAVAEPGGNLLARRMKGGKFGGDLADGIALGIALAGYVLKQVGRIRAARQLRDGGAVIEGLQHDLSQEPAEPAPVDFPVG